VTISSSGSLGRDDNETVHGIRLKDQTYFMASAIRLKACGYRGFQFANVEGLLTSGDRSARPRDTTPRDTIETLTSECLNE
jgi:hypothetical protein